MGIKLVSVTCIMPVNHSVNFTIMLIPKYLLSTSIVYLRIIKYCAGQSFSLFPVFTKIPVMYFWALENHEHQIAPSLAHESRSSSSSCLPTKDRTSSCSPSKDGRLQDEN